MGIGLLDARDNPLTLPPNPATPDTRSHCHQTRPYLTPAQQRSQQPVPGRACVKHRAGTIGKFKAQQLWLLQQGGAAHVATEHKGGSNTCCCSSTGVAVLALINKKMALVLAADRQAGKSPLDLLPRLVQSSQAGQ